MAIIILGIIQYCIQSNILEGLVWVICPLLLILVNELWYFMFNYLFGKNYLLAMPSLTYQGVIGSVIANSVLIILVFNIQYHYLVRRITTSP